MTMMENLLPSGDTLARQTALDTGRSFIVKAPAGSGKTELLTSRFLKLLAEVEAPEQILAITFTRAATAEMRNRILSELEKARDTPAASTDDEKLKLARRALQQAEQRNWHLLQQPHRLRIETIDSFCAALARQTPILSRLGGGLTPTEDAEPIYRLAARRTLQQIGGSKPDLNAAIRELLLLRDSNFSGCETLLARMLEQRDQWSHAFVLSAEFNWNNTYEAEVRRRLEDPFRRAIEKALRKAHQAFGHAPDAADELFKIAHFTCLTLRDPEHDKYHSHLEGICALEGLHTLPGTTIDQLNAWKAIACFLLTSSGTWRKALNRTIGLPPGSTAMKNRLEALLVHLGQSPMLLETLCEIRSLPPAGYSDDQWRLLRHFFTALRHATAELRVAFAERNEIDFVQLGMAAEQVLENVHDDEASEMVVGSSEQLKHLLVDEFQDVSRRQYRLITRLVRDWEEGDRRTCFLVGDPMQSIYLFRQAEVELFEGAYRYGLQGRRGRLSLSALELTKNFRSCRELVEPLNEAFSTIFAANCDPALQVPFTPAEAMEQGNGAPMLRLHTDFVIAGPEGKEAMDEAHEREAQEMLRILREHLPAIEAAAANGGEYRVAVLARAKNHLVHLTRSLHEAGIRFRAVELETLGERQEILDLVSLVRALLHPMDRIAWLSILRAPWCGLQMADLHTLCGADYDEFRNQPVPKLLRERSHMLTPQGRVRAERLQAIMQRAAQLRAEQLSMQSFAGLVEQVWYSLRGPLCVNPTGRENVELFLKMLSDLPQGEIDCLGEELTRRLNRLCAQPDPEASDRCGVVLMTIHKAKGLGFEVVLVPSLERRSRSDQGELLSWLERTVPAGEPDHGEDEILVAPIGSKGEPSDELKKWVECQRKAREAEERKRLLYVACTRARNELHLFGIATVTEKIVDGQIAGQIADISLTPGHASSLLHTGWPAFEKDFATALPLWLERRRTTQTGTPQTSTLLPFPESAVIDLAASGDEPQREKVLRLKADVFNAEPEANVTVVVTFSPQPETAVLVRPQGSLLARAFGVVVHTMLERLTLLLARATVADAREQVGGWTQQVTTLLVQQGVDPVAARSQTGPAIKALLNMLESPEGHWILAAHARAETEAQWTGVLQGALRKLRADRVFRAGSGPLIAGEECFWIIDYKTAECGAASVGDFLARQKLAYQQQLAAYAELVRLRYGAHAEVNAGLYFPLLQRLTWWKA